MLGRWINVAHQPVNDRVIVKGSLEDCDNSPGTSSMEAGCNRKGMLRIGKFDGRGTASVERLEGGLSITATLAINALQASPNPPDASKSDDIGTFDAAKRGTSCICSQALLRRTSRRLDLLAGTTPLARHANSEMKESE